MDFVSGANLLQLVGVPAWFFEKFLIPYWAQNIIVLLILSGFVAGSFRPKVLVAIANPIDRAMLTIGKFFAWFALLMVLQQVLVVAIQYTFKLANMSISPLGLNFSRPIQWWSEELRLYNAILICFGAGYTFVRGGHVRVDLVYGGLPYRAQKVIDLLGSLFLMMPMALVIWKYGLLYAYRSVARFDFRTLEFKAWKLEQSFNPSGFNAVYLFKLIIPLLAIFLFVQAISWAYRSYYGIIRGEVAEEDNLSEVRGTPEHHEPNHGLVDADVEGRELAAGTKTAEAR